MKNGIVSIFICMLFISSVIPVAGTISGNNDASIEKEKVIDVNNERQTQSDDDWWPMYRHDSGNTGSSGSLAPDINQVSWQTNINEEIYSTAPVIADDRLFISTNWYYLDGPPIGDLTKTPIDEWPTLSEILEKMIYEKDDYFGGLYCRNADSGQPLWDVPLFAPNDPAVVDDKVYVTDLGIYSYYSSLYCLNAATGATIWQQPVGGLVLSPTIVYDDKIYIGSLDYYYSYSGQLECFDLDGNNIWSYPLPMYQTLWNAAPAVYDGKVYFLTTDMNSYYNGYLFCLDAETGEYQWSEPIFSWGGYWYFGSSQSPVCAEGKVYAFDIDLYSYNGYMKCFDAENGGVLWTYTIGWSFSTPAFADDSIYVTSLDLYSYRSWMYRLNATTGSMGWRVPIPGFAYFYYSGSPVVADTKVFICPLDIYTYHSTLYCFNADNGHPLWEYTLNSISLSSPAVADGRVYIADMMGNIYAFGERNEPPDTPSITGPDSGKIGESYDYTFVSTDLDGDDVWYYIEWDDGHIEEWIGPYDSGEEVSVSHTWEEQGDYTIRAKAKDIYDFYSDWGYLEITMPVNQQNSHLLIQRIINRFPNAFPILRNLFEL